MDSLCYDLFKAYYSARRNKRNTVNQLRFELNFEQELFRLHDELVNRTYQPGSAIAFVVNEPVKREIFAADFRDRVIHHLLFNYINPVVDKHLIFDCYSCRAGKGTSGGIRRVARFMRACSDNYSRGCYVLKLDIKAYFININRQVLYQMVNELLQKEYKKAGNGQSPLSFDHGLVDFLLRRIIFTDPVKNCKIRGSFADWDGLPRDKSLFYASGGCGLPIGNLTSQLFGNIYMAGFDHWMKRQMGFRYYGRYVDDMVVFHHDKQVLLAALSLISDYLSQHLGLTLHPRKIYLQHYSKGLSFLGAIIKPGRMYAGKRVIANFADGIKNANTRLDRGEDPGMFADKLVKHANSYLGLMKHYRTYRLRKKVLLGIHPRIREKMVVTKHFTLVKNRKGNKKAA